VNNYVRTSAPVDKSQMQPKNMMAALLIKLSDQLALPHYRSKKRTFV
jgi:hypothetical protein